MCGLCRLWFAAVQNSFFVTKEENVDVKDVKDVKANVYEVVDIVMK